MRISQQQLMCETAPEVCVVVAVVTTATALSSTRLLTPRVLFMEQLHDCKL